jgi:hypothetical protein
VHPMMIESTNYLSEEISTSLLTRLTRRDFTTIGRDLRLVEKTTRRFYVLKQSNKARAIKRFDSRVASS